MDDQTLLATMLFSETKDINDALDIANVAKNRALQGGWWGNNIQEVVLKPKQFTGVGSKEWNKVVQNKLTPQEKAIYDQFYDLSGKVLINSLPDTTEGATHYFNPKLVTPNWAKKMKKVSSSKFHDYYKE